MVARLRGHSPIRKENLMNVSRFEDFNLSPEIFKALTERGFEHPTVIQEKAIPLGLSGRDFIGQSQTGTGKTLAFAIPIIEQIDRKLDRPQAIILCPTRELAVQVSSEIHKVCKYNKVKVLPVYGGESIERQIKFLRQGVQIVVGTPGRVLDHIKRKTLKLGEVRFAVLDEADEMLDMGFIEDIESILSQTQEDRQTMLFSATMPKAIATLAKNYLVNPDTIKVASKQVTVDRIEQKFIRVRNSDKPEILSRIIQLEESRKTIVFCNTKRMVDELTANMQERGYGVEGLHGDLKQQKRDYVMDRFKRGNIDILIATDVAARGIDIKNVDMVVNYDLPQEDEQYVHRIGRTGRAGRTGKSYSFAFGRDLDKLRNIEKYASCVIEEAPIPKYADVKEKMLQNYVDGITEREIPSDLDAYLQIVDRIKETGMELETFLALVLKENLVLSDEDQINYQDYDRKQRARTSNGGSSNGGRSKKVEKGMVRFHINVGKKSKARVADIVGAVAGECDIAGKKIGSIDLFDNYTFFEVPEKYESTVLKKMKNVKIKGKKVSAQLSK